MPSLGFRSIEVHIINNVDADFSVGNVMLAGSSEWIPGEEAKPNSTVRQFADVDWGVMTNDEDGGAMATVSLEGLGPGPIEIAFHNLGTSESGVVFTGNDRVEGRVEEIESEEENHLVFELVLMPSASPQRG